MITKAEIEIIMNQDWNELSVPVNYICECQVDTHPMLSVMEVIKNGIGTETGFDYGEKERILEGVENWL